MYAQGKQVWEYVNPDTAVELEEPQLPVMPEGDLTKAQYNTLQLQISLYSIRYSNYNEANRRLESLLHWILSTVSLRWLFRLEDTDTIRQKVKVLRDALDTDEVTKRVQAQLQQHLNMTSQWGM